MSVDFGLWTRTFNVAFIFFRFLMTLTTRSMDFVGIRMFSYDDLDSWLALLDHPALAYLSDSIYIHTIAVL